MRYVVVFIIFLLVSVILAPLRGGYFCVLGLEGIYLYSFVSFFILQLMTFLCLRKVRNSANPFFTLLAILLGVFILELPIRIMDFDGTLFTLGSSLLAFLGIASGFILFKVQSKVVQVGIFVLFTLFTFWFSYSGYELWMHKLSFGSFTGEIEETISQPLIFQSATGEGFSLSEHKGKYVLLDFWNSKCGVCISQFPEVQRVYEQLKGNTTAEIYSVFCRMPKHNETYGTGDSIVRKRKFSFPVILMDIDDPVLKEVGVTTFPTIIIFNPDGKVVFRGRLESAIDYLRSKMILKE